jgi:hypothetical protein
VVAEVIGVGRHHAPPETKAWLRLRVAGPKVADRTLHSTERNVFGEPFPGLVSVPSLGLARSPPVHKAWFVVRIEVDKNRFEV